MTIDLFTLVDSTATTTTEDSYETTMAPHMPAATLSVPEVVTTPEAGPMGSWWFTITTLALMGLAITVNLIATTTVMLKSWRRHTRAHIYAISFFMAVVLYCLNNVIMHYRQIFLSTDTDFEEVIVHGHIFLEFASRGAMVIALGGVVNDRYRAISDVTSYCARSQLRTSCCYALLGWVVAILFAVPVLAGLTGYWYTTYASLRPVDIFTGIHTALFYLLPLIVFTFVTPMVMCGLVSFSRGHSLDSYVTKGDINQPTTRIRLTVAIIAAVTVFVFTWMLYLTVLVIEGFFPNESQNEVIRLAGILVVYAGLSVCPVLVCVVCADYRSLDSQRRCTCCSVNQPIVPTLSKAWSSTKQNPYYV